MERMNVNDIRIVVKRPGEPPVVEEVPPGLETMQRIVGGYIEPAMKALDYFHEGGHLLAYVNEDGIAQGLAPNIHRPSDGSLLVGAIVVVKIDNDGEDMSMTAPEAARAMQTIEAMRAAGPPSTTASMRDRLHLVAFVIDLWRDGIPHSDEDGAGALVTEIMIATPERLAEIWAEQRALEAGA
jgi:hypothetical protein